MILALMNKLTIEEQRKLLKEELIKKINDNDLDTIVMGVLINIVERAIIGKQKYNTDLDRDDISLKNWIKNALEEQFDNSLYLYKAGKMLND